MNTFIASFFLFIVFLVCLHLRNSRNEQVVNISASFEENTVIGINGYSEEVALKILK